MIPLQDVESRLTPEQREARAERNARALESLSDQFSAMGGWGSAIREASERLADLMRQPWYRKLHHQPTYESYLRRCNNAHFRSCRNQPSLYNGLRVRSYWTHPSTSNRKRNRHGRVGVAR